MQRAILFVADMDCPVEVQLIENRLRRWDAIGRLDFDLMRREVSVEHSLADPGELVKVVKALGLSARLQSGPADAGGAPVQPPSRWLPIWWPLALSGVAALTAELLTLFSGAGHSGEHGHEAHHSPVVIGLAAVSVGFGGWQTLQKGWTALRNLTLNIHFLMMLAVAGAVAIGEWPEAAMVTFLFALSERIEAGSLNRARNAIQQLMALSPEEATVRDSAGDWRRVPAAAVQLGASVQVRPGERVPLDGTVQHGRSFVNQAPITGESLPVEKGPGDPVFAGSVNELGAFEFEVSAATGDTTLDHIVRTVREAQSRRAPTERMVDQFARYYTPTVVVLAVLLTVLPPLLGQGPVLEWFSRSLVLLVIACPCALVLSTPVTVVSALAAGARLGLLIKGGAVLEAGRGLGTIAFDKTGTLTRGKPVVTDVTPLIEAPPGELLHRAASLNFYSEHPVAAAIVTHCAHSHADTQCRLLPVTEFEALTGRGVRGKIEGRAHFVGNHRLAEENHVCGPHVEAVLARLEAEGKTGVVLTTDQEALAVVGVADELRSEGPEAVRALHALGLRTVLLSGDSAAPVRAAGVRAGIDDVRAELLPGDKLQAIVDLGRSGGGVGMVGDGINDAPALAHASVGFAMGVAGAGAALETADVALMHDDLRLLPEFVRLCRATGSVLRQNIALAVGIKVVFFVLALTGRANLWMAVFADVGASLLVVANGLRLLRFGVRDPRTPHTPHPTPHTHSSHTHSDSGCCGHTH